MSDAKRRSFNERFMERLLARRPQDRQRVEEEIRRLEPELVPRLALETGANLEGMPDSAGPARLRAMRDFALETIVSRERPVLFGKRSMNCTLAAASCEVGDADGFGSQAFGRAMRQGSRAS